MGAVMSYSLGLGAGRPRPAAIIALSGFIPEVEGFELDMGKAAGLPVAIGHGTHDPVISVEFGRDARDRLVRAGADLLYRESADATHDRPRVPPRTARVVARDAGLSRGGTPGAAGRASARKNSEKPPIGFVVVPDWLPPAAGGAIAAPSGVAATTASTMVGSAAGGASIRCWRQSANSFISRFEMS